MAPQVQQLLHPANGSEHHAVRRRQLEGELLLADDADHAASRDEAPVPVLSSGHHGLEHVQVGESNDVGQHGSHHCPSLVLAQPISSCMYGPVAGVKFAGWASPDLVLHLKLPS